MKSIKRFILILLAFMAWNPALEALAPTNTVSPAAVDEVSFFRNQLRRLPRYEQVLLIWEATNTNLICEKKFHSKIQVKINSFFREYHELFPKRFWPDYRRDWHDSAKKLLPEYLSSIDLQKGDLMDSKDLQHSYIFKIRNPSQPKRNRFIKLGKTGFGTEQVFQESKMTQRLLEKGLSQRHFHLDPNSNISIHEIDGDYFLAFQTGFIDGEDLNHYLKTNLKPSLIQTLEWMETLLQIAIELREAKIFFRDISDENIMLLKEGGLKIVDFGLAIEEQEYLSTFSRYHQIYKGSFPYIHPDIMSGTRRQHRHELWSYGVIFYQLFASALSPFGLSELTNEPWHVLEAIRSHSPPLDLSLYEKDLAKYEAAKIINKMLSLDFMQGYQSAEEVLGDLAQVKSHLPSSHPTSLIDQKGQLAASL